MTKPRTPQADRTAWRLKTYPVAVIAAVVVAVLMGTFLNARSGTAGDAIGGDYPAFYGAGRVAAAGDLDELYVVQRQVEAQAGLHGLEEGQVARFFPYPAQFAVVYQPLSYLPYHWSYLVHTLMMGLLLLASILLMRPMLAWLCGRVTLALAGALLFWPMFRTITGGSNTALTLFLIVATWRLIHDDRHLSAGVVLAALLFKPQLAIPMLGLFALARYWRVVLGACLGAAAYYMWGVALQGWSWALDWAEMARDFGAKEAEINGHSSISFIGFAQNVFGVGTSVPVILAWLCASAMVIFLCWIWWHRDSASLARRLAVTIPGTLLLAPHVMTHDGALIVVTAAVAVQAWSRHRWGPWIAVIWALGATQSMIMHLGFSPGFLMLLIIMAMAWQLLSEDRDDGAMPASAHDHDPAGVSENSS
jgi:hypothetical protein